MPKYPYSTFATTIIGGAQIVPLNANFDFETTTSPWVPGTSTALSVSPNYSVSGKNSMLVTATGTLSNIGCSSEKTIPVTVGNTYTFSYYALADTTGNPVAGTVTAAIAWLKADGVTTISTSTSSATSIQSPKGKFTLVTVTGVAPALAAFGWCQILELGSVVSGNQFYVDDAVLAGGSQSYGATAGITQVSLTCQPHSILEVDTVGLANTSSVNLPSCQVFAGPLPLQQFYLGALPNQNNGQILLTQPALITMGNFLWAVWSGGDIGAVGTLTAYGSRINGYKENPHQ